MHSIQSMYVPAADDDLNVGSFIVFLRAGWFAVAIVELTESSILQWKAV